MTFISFSSKTLCVVFADAKCSVMFGPNHCKESIQKKDSLMNRISQKTWELKNLWLSVPVFFLLETHHKTVRGQRLYSVFHGKEESCHTITSWLLIGGKKSVLKHYWKNKTNQDQNHENRTSAYGDNMAIYTFLNLFGSRYIFWDKHSDFWLLGNTQCAKNSINFLSK